MQGNSEREIRKKQYRLYIIILAFLCVVICAYTIVWEVSYYHKYGFFKETEAVVIDHEIDGNLTYDVLSYTVDNVEFQKTTAYLSKNEVGDTIKIFYDSTNPIGVIYKLDSTRILLPIISVLLLLVLTGFTILYCITFKRNTMQSVEK